MKKLTTLVMILAGITFIGINLYSPSSYAEEAWKEAFLKLRAAIGKLMKDNQSLHQEVQNAVMSGSGLLYTKTEDYDMSCFDVEDNQEKWDDRICVIQVSMDMLFNMSYPGGGFLPACNSLDYPIKYGVYDLSTMKEFNKGPIQMNQEGKPISTMYKTQGDIEKGYDTTPIPEEGGENTTLRALTICVNVNKALQ